MKSFLIKHNVFIHPIKMQTTNIRNIYAAKDLRTHKAMYLSDVTSHICGHSIKESNSIGRHFFRV